MPTRDFYNVLDVDRDASAEEIKRAYRRAAMRWHPDRNQGDTLAEERFKDINEAYRVLSDPSERARYDRLGPLYAADGAPPSPDDLSQVVRNMWNSVFNRKRSERGEDLKMTVNITLEQVAVGDHIEITVPRQVKCGSCFGFGCTKAQRATCETCKGSGWSGGPRLLRTPCFHCSGDGWVAREACSTCSGDGRVTDQATLTVNVPAGVATGQKLKLARRGNEARRDGASGDLLVSVHVETHELFRRRGDDLVVDLPLTFLEAATGADLPVPTLDHVTTIRIPAGTVHGQQFRLSGRGLPSVHRSAKGDLHARVVIEVPQHLTPEEQQRLQTWSQGLSSSAHPLKQAYLERLKKR